MRARRTSRWRNAVAAAFALPMFAVPAAALERFSYCGTIQVVGDPQTAEGVALPIVGQLFPLLRGGYVGPVGITPIPPRSCAWVVLGEVRGDRYLPTIVVWSDVPTPISYHADIYSDPRGIFGHRQEQPSDYNPAGLAERTREMEKYLDAAAGEPVLLAVLDALRAGRTTATLERDLPVPLPAGAGMTITMPVR